MGTGLDTVFYIVANTESYCRTILCHEKKDTDKRCSKTLKSNHAKKLNGVYTLGKLHTRTTQCEWVYRRMQF